MGIAKAEGRASGRPCAQGGLYTPGTAAVEMRWCSEDVSFSNSACALTFSCASVRCK